VPGRPWEDPHILPPSEVGKLAPLDRAGVDVPGGELTLLFGAFRVPLSRSRVEAIRFLQALLAGGVADTAGVLLALIWTAGFLPGFLEPASASVLLAKPVPRWTLLTGKFVGVLLFVAGQAALFVAATWLALGLRTGVWEAGYFWGVPILLFHFACFYSVSAFLAVTTRSTVACVLGTLAFWALCWGVNYGRHEAFMASGSLGSVPQAIELTYWLLPKPADFGLLLVDALDADAFFGTLPVLRSLQERGAWHPDAAVFSSVMLPVGLLLIAAWRLARAEY
jgi:hypothetical protein